MSRAMDTMQVCPRQASFLRLACRAQSCEHSLLLGFGLGHATHSEWFSALPSSLLGSVSDACTLSS
jgi:hypothetical protein